MKANIPLEFDSDEEEAEYDFHMKRMFADLEQVQRKINNRMKYRELVEAADNFTMEGMMEAIGPIEYSIKLYIHDGTPANAWRENFIKNLTESKDSRHISACFMAESCGNG